MGLSKSRYTAGLQCHRQLWWRVHEPDAPELVPDAEQQAVFDNGSRVGRLARERVPGGVLIDFPHTAIAERLAATQQALQTGARVIYEASFLADDTFAAVDILERVGDPWRLIEVKSTSSVKPEHLRDVAVQVHVVRTAGLLVERAELMHLNRECAYPRLDNLFARDDVTDGVEPLLSAVPAEIGRQLEMLRGPLPAVPIGPHCDAPYECPFKARCWPAFPAHHISTLYHIGTRWWELEARGCSTISELPADFALRPPSERQRRSIRAGATIVEPGLGRALAALESPIALIDFETLSPSIPVWDGCHPYDPVPAQFSCHVEDGRGGWTHHEWLADGPGDPRPELVRRLADACEGAGSIVAYNSSYEAHCLRLIGQALPPMRRPIESLLARLVDALPLVRDYVYHPAFGGTFGLKAVLPALVPGLGYQRLEITKGTTARRELERLLLDADSVSAEERARSRAALLSYCELDTWGVAKLLETLGDLAGTSIRAPTTGDRAPTRPERSS